MPTPEPYTRHPKPLRVDRHGAWSQDAWDAAEDRDAEARVTRPVSPSQSSHPARCAGCGHWSLPRAVCRECGLAWAPVALVGPKRVTG